MAVDFLLFIRMIKAHKYLFDNISLRLFFGTVRFMSKRITTKRFGKLATDFFTLIVYILWVDQKLLDALPNTCVSAEWAIPKMQELIMQFQIKRYYHTLSQ